MCRRPLNYPLSRPSSAISISWSPEQVRWGEIARTIQSAAGADLERLVYRDTYRDPERLGAGKKSFLFTLILRRREATLTSAEADQVRDAVVAACAAAHGAQLRA